MSNVQIIGLMSAHKKNRRANAERKRELSNFLKHRAYRGVEVDGPEKAREIHGTFTYRGRTYSK